MKKSVDVVHAIAECEDCGMRWEDYMNAKKQAGRHARKFRHKVSGEIGLSFMYDCRNSAST